MEGFCPESPASHVVHKNPSIAAFSAALPQVTGPKFLSIYVSGLPD